jgi:hypothetical protein
MQNNSNDNFFNESAEPKKAAPKGLIIDVPYAEKDQAKALGAKWNPEAKKWFIPDGVAQDKFTKWIK